MPERHQSWQCAEADSLSSVLHFSNPQPISFPQISRTLVPSDAHALRRHKLLVKLLTVVRRQTITDSVASLRFVSQKSILKDLRLLLLQCQNVSSCVIAFLFLFVVFESV